MTDNFQQNWEYLEDIIIPLVPEEIKSTEDKDKDKYATYELTVDSTDTNSTNYEKKLKIFDGLSNAEGVLKWREEFNILQKNIPLSTGPSQFKWQELRYQTLL